MRLPASFRAGGAASPVPVGPAQRRRDTERPLRAVRTKCSAGIVRPLPALGPPPQPRGFASSASGWDRCVPGRRGFHSFLFFFPPLFFFPLDTSVAAEKLPNYWLS